MAQGVSGYVDFTGSSQGGSQTLRVYYSETYEQSTNKSTVSITSVWLKSNANYGTYYGNFVLKLGGTTILTASEESGNAVVTLSNGNFTEVKKTGSSITGSITVDHAADGTGSTTIALSKNTGDSPYFWTSTWDWPYNSYIITGGTRTITLTTIPRQYTLSISAGTGSSIAVTRNGTPLSNGATITYGDSLVVAFYASTGYSLGTQTVTVAGTAYTGGGTYTVTGAVSVVSTASPIRSTISAPNGAFGSPLSITVTRYSTAYSHVIAYSCAGYTGQIYIGSATSISWTPPESLMNGIPNATSASCVLTCTTYNGNTQVGTHSITITLSVPASVAPSVSSGWASASYTNSGTAAASVSAALVGYSKLTVTLDVGKISLPYSATLSSVKITYGSDTRTRTTSGTETFAAIGSTTATATLVITDSRGRTYSGTVSQTAYAYSAPSLSGASAYRCNSGGTADEEGAYYRAYAVMSYTAADGAISASLTTRIKSAGGGYGSDTTLQSGTASVLGGGLSYLTVYVAEIRATDSLGNTAVLEFTIPTAAVAFNIRDGGKGAAFGKYAGEDNLLDVAWPIVSPTLQVDRENKTSFTFTNLRLIDSPYHFKYGLLFGGDSPGCVYLVFVHTSNTVTLTPIISTNVTLTGQVSGTSLIISASGTVWGGLRLIWMN